MITLQVPAIHGRAPAFEQPSPRRPGPEPRPQRPDPRPELPPEPRPRPGRGDAERIETIERVTAETYGQIQGASHEYDNIGWQLELGYHAHRRNLLSPKLGPYLQGRINAVSHEGINAAAQEGAFQAIRAIEGTRSGRQGPVVNSAHMALERISAARCAAISQSDMLQQGLDALLKMKPHPDPCAPLERQPDPEPEPRPVPRPGRRGEELFEQESSAHDVQRTRFQEQRG